MLAPDPVVRSNRTLTLFATLALACGLSACDLPPDETEQVSGAVSWKFYAAGKFQTVIKTCDWSPVAAHPTASCDVDHGFVLIGGGAEVEGNTPNALLTGSFPDSDLRRWHASSKDHLVSWPHRVRAYAIGLMITSTDEATLRSQMRVVSVDSPRAAHPTATAQLPPDFLMTGGGARVNVVGAGSLLTESRPDGENQWKGSAKDHGISAPTTISVSVIGMPRCFFGDCFAVSHRRTGSPPPGEPTGFVSWSFPTTTGYVPTCVGGQAQYTGSGRLLTKLVPFATNGVSGAFVQSKDHVYRSAGTTDAWTSNLRLALF